MAHPNSVRTRADFLNATGVLLVVRDPPPANPPAPGQPAAVPGNPAEGVEILGDCVQSFDKIFWDPERELSLD
mgnify:CR=1 FL=1